MNELMPILSVLGTGIMQDSTEKENAGGLELQGLINLIMKSGINFNELLTKNGLDIVLIIAVIALLSSNSQSN